MVYDNNDVDKNARTPARVQNDAGQYGSDSENDSKGPK
jgi:hypothetical protein